MATNSETSESLVEAILDVARSERAVAMVTEELPRVAAAVETSAELRSVLADATIPAGRRQQVIEEVLGGSAAPATLAVVSMLVALGRGADLPEIATEVLRGEAASRGEELAEVRTAVPLSDPQTERLTQALRTATGRNVTVRNIVDPSVLGGVVTQIGDTVLDGSVRSRLTQLRDAF